MSKGFVCDGENDCQDQSDESGCVQPVIIRGPTRNITVTLGSTIRIECQARGFPAPFINWRLNWGHVCEAPRCESTSEDGYGVLKIKNAQREDAGAYSCEALNSKGRVFAVPDAIVTVIVESPPTNEVECNCNGHSNDCDKNGVCYNCQDFTTGPNCDRCIDGYEGDATFENPCRPIEVERCDAQGSANEYPPCRCKAGATGRLCDRCDQDYFKMNGKCASCFCNSVSDECTGADLYYNKIESKFERDTENWRVSNLSGDLQTLVRVRNNGIEFDEFDEYPEQDMFFFAPKKFLNDKLTSYDGNLSFNIRHEGSSGSETNKLEIRIEVKNILKN